MDLVEKVISGCVVFVASVVVLWIVLSLVQWFIKWFFDAFD